MSAPPKPVALSEAALADVLLLRAVEGLAVAAATGAAGAGPGQAPSASGVAAGAAAGHALGAGSDPASDTRPPWHAADAAWASAQARQQVGESGRFEAFVQARALSGLARLRQNSGWPPPAGSGPAETALARPAVRRWGLAVWLLLAFALGLAGESLTHGRQLPVLSLPLLALVLWNAVMLLAALLAPCVGTWRGWRAPAAGPAASWSSPWPPTAPGAHLATGQVSGWLARAGRGWGLWRSPGLAAARRTATQGWQRAALRLAGQDHAVATAGVTGWRAAAGLHAAAAALALGVVASLYLRGTVLDFRASWESTFFSAAHVHRLLGVLLWPSVLLLGWPLPSVEVLEGLRWVAPGAGSSAGMAGLVGHASGVAGAAAAAGQGGAALGPGVGVGPGAGVGTGAALAAAEAASAAAPWIHRIAFSLGVWVVAPRLLWAALSWARARHLAARLPWPADDAYLRRLRPEAPGRVRPVSVLPYSYQVPPAARLGLAPALAERLGAGAQPLLMASVPMGAEDRLPQHLAQPPAPPLAAEVVALLSLTATPERETHGRFLQALQPLLPTGGRLQVWLDASVFEQRLAGQPDAAPRLQQRQQAWARLLGELGLPAPVVLNLARLGAAA